MRRRIWFATVAFGCGWPASVAAQATSAGMAEALFEDGRALMRQGSLELACAKLDESYRLDPAVGTLLSYADCEERRGHFATAWALWLEAASEARFARQTEREALARARALRAREKLGTLTLDVPIESRAPGLTITCDGTAWGPASWGTEAPLDPGEHTLVVAAPEHKALQEKLMVSAGRSLRFRVPSLALAPNAKPSLAPPLTSTTAPSSSSAGALPSAATSDGGHGAGGWFRGLAWLSGLGSLALLALLTWRAAKQDAGPRGSWARRSWLPAAALAALVVLGVTYALIHRSTTAAAPVAELRPPSDVKVMRVAGDPWSGYSTFRGEPRLAAELAKSKLRIEYVDDPALYDQDARMKALAEGKIDAAVTTIDAFLQHGAKHRIDGKYPGVIVWNIDESNGGDAVFLAKGRSGFDSVRPTDKVCYSTGTPSEHLWDFASLSFANLGDKLATDNGVVASDCWKKLTEGSVQIAVLWQPTTAIALKAGYPKAFSTGGQADDVIIDVLVVGRAYLEKQRPVVTALTRAYFATIDTYVKDVAAHAAFVTKDCGPDCGGDEGLGNAVLEGIDFLTYQENMCLWWGHCDAPAKMPERIAKTARLLTAKKKLSADEVPQADTILDDRALVELQTELASQARLAAEVVGANTKIATPKLEARERTYQYQAAATRTDPSRDVGTLRLPNVYFPEASARLDQNAMSVVEAIAEQLRGFPALCVRVFGYTSSSGNPNHNRQLSEARALAITDYLFSLDQVMFQRSRFDVQGFGSSAPIMRGSAEDFSASRRTEFKLFDCEDRVVSAR
jgi:outer membrane protein OmpA-like peptidoglycan-associated protein